MTTPTVRQLFDRKSCTYTYLLVCPKTQDAVLVDPVLECSDRDLEAVSGMRANLKLVLNTHVHADHVTGSGKLKASVPGLRSVISEASSAVADITVKHGDTITFGECELQVRSTPGHTPGCVAYVNRDHSFVITGDTLLIRGCGRTDFQGGDPAVLYDSVLSQIFSLPASAVIWPGHDYSGRTCTTVEEEMANNPRLSKKKDEFIDLMKKQFDGSSYPAMIDQALPANMVCGVFENGLFDTNAVPVKHPGGFVWIPKDALK
jgi:sulfur dioxygenase